MPPDSFCRLKPPYTRVTAMWKITAACNLRCPHCFTGRDEPEPAAWEGILDQLAQLQVARVVITGGEPLLHPGVVDLVARLSRLGISTSLLSNGLLLTAAKARQLKAAGLENASISLHHHLPEPHDQISQGAAVLEHVKQAFRACRAADLRFNVSSVVLPGNAGQIAQLIDFAFQEGAVSLSLNSFVPFPGLPAGLDRWRQSWQAEDVLAVVAQKRAAYGEGFIKTAGFVVQSPAFTCPAGTFLHGISPSGEWTPCLSAAETCSASTWQGVRYSWNAYKDRPPVEAAHVCPLL
jgi:MoaA/NifB/PqqE/SkfB family radical SAM enzyme